MVTLKRCDGTVIGEGETIKDVAVQHRGYLQGAYLRSAYLRSADLQGAYLQGAYLRSAYLRSADLRSAYLRSADLQGADLQGAYLRSADLRDANLRGADLRSADLRGADLQGAYLRGAKLHSVKLDPRTVLPTGETWERYLAEVVPALLTAGGKTVEEIVASGAWECHEWDNCPTAVAFGAESLSGVPILLRPRAEQFIQFFDAGLIPEPEKEAR